MNEPNPTEALRLAQIALVEAIEFMPASTMYFVWRDRNRVAIDAALAVRGKLARQADDFTLTPADRAELTTLLDDYASDIEADIICHCIADEDRPMPEDAGYVARQRTLWRKVQAWMRRLELPSPEFDPTAPAAAKSIP